MYTSSESESSADERMSESSAGSNYDRPTRPSQWFYTVYWKHFLYRKLYKTKKKDSILMVRAFVMDKMTLRAPVHII